MSGPQSGSPNQSFADRLNRVADARAPIDGAKPEVSVLPDWKQNIRYPGALVLAALFGMISVFAARYARFHLMGGSLAGDDADITMMIDGAIAAACSFILFGMLRFEGPEFKAAQTVGIVGMICIMHNFVHAAPKAFDVVFSKEWTNEVVVMTEPNSILFRGVSFALSEPEQDVAGLESPATPRVLSLGGKSGNAGFSLKAPTATEAD